VNDAARERAARAVAARDLAWTAAALLAIDPRGVGGIHLRARPGPELDAWTTALRDALGERPLRRMPPHIDAGRLTGELDLVGSLREGRRMVRSGLLTEADGGVVLVPMAERLEREAGAVLAEALDTGRILSRLPGLGYAPAEVAAVLVDESRDDEPGLPDIVQQRMGCLVVLEPVGAKAAPPPLIDPARVSRARDVVSDVIAEEADMETFVLAAARLGIESLRAPIRALRVARAHRAWRASAENSPRSAPLRLGDDDLAVAAALALLPRATVAPAPPESADDSTPPPPPPPAESGDDAGDDLDGPTGPLAERIVEAAEAYLPEGLVSRFAEARARGTGRRGAKLRQLMHGHRVGARRGDPRRGGRVDLPATLRAAAPWQRTRRTAAERDAGGAPASDGTPGPRVHVRASDLHVQERVRRSATATVFVVDASGSQALNRLAEVKGAVELFLAESYVRRDQVALVVFRDRGATVAVPPTRSLVRVRRLLRGTAGGGGTPLAAGLEQAWKIALRLEASEASPRIVLLSDGRPNVGLDGAGGRTRAREDALDVARRIAASGIPTLVLDSSARGERFAIELGEALRGTVAHLPRPDARGLRRALDLFGADAP
jgi:magnesium chelatase subunit D